MFELRIEKDKTKNTLTGIIILVLFFALSFIADVFRIYGFYKQAVLLIYSVFACYYLLHFTIMPFTYILDSSQLIIKKISKTKTEIVYFVNKDDVKVIAHKKNSVLDKYDGKALCVTAGFFDPDYYILVHKQNKTYKKIKLENSKELISKLKEAFGDKVYE